MKQDKDEVLIKTEIGRAAIDKGEDFFYLDISELYRQIKKNPRLISKMNYDNGEEFEQVLMKRYKFRHDGEELSLKLVDWRPEKINSKRSDVDSDV
jgi:hypothetical protein